MPKIYKLACVALALPFVAVPQVARAQDYPKKPITTIVFGAPGTTPDLFARALTKQMSESMGQPIVVDNRPGSAGVVATTTAIKAPPDGYTLLFTSSTALVNTQYTMKKVPFSPERDLTPIGTTFEPVEVLLIRADLPFKNLADLIAYAKKNPGKLSYGASALGTTLQLNAEQFASAAGIKLVHVPYKGPVAAMQDLAAGNVDIAFNSYAGVPAMVSMGKVRVLATLEKQRYKGLPDVPTIAETLPGYQKINAWFALMGPARLPQPIVNRLHDEMTKALKTPELAHWMQEQYAQPLGGSPVQVTEQMKTSSARVKQMVEKIGLKAE